MTSKERGIQRKRKVLLHAEQTGHVAKTYRHFGIGRASFYRWKSAYRESGEKILCFQYSAIDDATRVRALKIYEKHTQASAIDFVDHIIGKFPFRIKEIRTDNGHEFQAKFHWYVEDKGIRHAYIKRVTPRLNGKVERSRRSDQEKFYQPLSYKGDVDLGAKLDEWEAFYSFNRPHGAFNGKTPYKALREKL